MGLDIWHVFEAELQISRTVSNDVQRPVSNGKSVIDLRPRSTRKFPHGLISGNWGCKVVHDVAIPQRRLFLNRGSTTATENSLQNLTDSHDHNRMRQPLS